MEYCKEIVIRRKTALLDRGSIPVGRSASAFILADPYGVLEEDECYLCFSSTFTDETSGFSGVMLHDIDVLVTRSPAHTPSDVQKVSDLAINTEDKDADLTSCELCSNQSLRDSKMS